MAWFNTTSLSGFYLSLSHVWLFETPWTATCQASLSITNSWSLLKLMSIESVLPSSHLILCHPFLLPPSIFPSIRVFSNESASDGQCISWYSYLRSQWTSLQVNLCPHLSHFFGWISKKWNYWVKHMNFQSSCYCHTTSYTLSINLQFIAPKKKQYLYRIRYIKQFIYFPTTILWLLHFVVIQSQVVSSSLWPHGLQHPRLPCPSLSPRLCLSSCSLNWWCHPTISSCLLLVLPSAFPSIRVFSSELALCTRCPKYWSFSFTISPSNEYSALISFRIDWFDPLAVQATLKSLLQHHSLKASILCN